MESLQNLARPSGAFAMVAMDQRESLRNIFLERIGQTVGDDVLTDFKVAVARLLSPHASALLVDRQYGLRPTLDAGALDPGCALMVAADVMVQEPGELASDTYLDDELDLDEVVAAGARGLKLLVIWRDDGEQERRVEMTREFIARSHSIGLPAIVEGVVRSAGQDEWDREDAIVDAARHLGALAPDLYKGEVPLFGRGPADAIRERAQQITDVLDCPWVVLSAGVRPDDFEAAAAAACAGGASGFLAGRGLWTDAVGAGDPAASLAEISVPRLQRLGEIVDRVARPWLEAGR